MWIRVVSECFGGNDDNREESGDVVHSKKYEK